MRKFYGLCLLVLIVIQPVLSSAEENTYYSRSNLKMIGNKITWLNWQASPDMLPVGTKLIVKGPPRVSVTGAGVEEVEGNKAELIEYGHGKTYVLDVGSSDKKLLEKFFVKEPMVMERFAVDVLQSIKDGIAKVGMTKEEVYVAMGPPAFNAVKTEADKMFNEQSYSVTKAFKDSGYVEIMADNLWVYKYRKSGHNILIVFDGNTGMVSNIEKISSH